MIDKGDEWLETVRQDLHRGVDGLDPGISLKLAEIRRQALARATARSRYAYVLPAAVLASACLVLALVLYFPRPQPKPIEMIDDLDLITNSQNLDLIENLDFYEWLEDYDLPS